MANTPRIQPSQKSAQAVIDALDAMFDELPPDSLDDADAVLRAHGLDPDEVGRATAKLASRMSESVGSAPRKSERDVLTMLEDLFQEMAPDSASEADQILQAANLDPAQVGRDAARVAAQASADAAAADAVPAASARDLLHRLLSGADRSNADQAAAQERVVFRLKGGGVASQTSSPGLSADEARVVALDAARRIGALGRARRAKGGGETSGSLTGAWSNAAHATIPSGGPDAPSQRTPSDPGDDHAGARTLPETVGCSIHVGDGFLAVIVADYRRGRYELEALVLDHAGTPVPRAVIRWRKQQSWNESAVVDGAARITSRNKGGVDLCVVVPGAEELAIRAEFAPADDSHGGRLDE